MRWLTMCAFLLSLILGSGQSLARPGAGKADQGAPRPYVQRGSEVLETEPNDDCSIANGPLGLGSAFEAQITPGDVDWFQFEAAAGQEVVFETHEWSGHPLVDTILALFAPDCNTVLAYNDDGGAGLYSLISYDFTAAGTYFLVVEGYDSLEDGFYVLTAEDISPATNNTCDTAIDLYVQGQQTFDINTCSGTDEYSPAGCIPWSLNGPDLVYKIDLPGGAEFSITIFSNHDAALYLVDDCPDVNNSCLIGADSWYGGQAEILTYTTTTAGTYWLVLDAETECGVVNVTINSPQVDVPVLNPTQREIAAGWSLLGLPLLPDPPGDLQDVILDDVTGEAYLFRHLGDSGYEIGNAADPAVQGEGLWIVTDQSFTWTMDGSLDLDGTAVPLRNGWTLVGYPLGFSGNLDGVEVDFASSRHTWADAVAAGIVSAAVYGYDNGSAGYELVTELDAWHGYWFAGLQEGAELWFDWPNLWPSARVGGVPQYAAKSSDHGWRVTINLSESEGVISSVAFGVHPEATPGFDAAFDFPAPPPAPGGNPREIAFVHPEWQLNTGRYFLSDVVAPVDQYRHQWLAEIRGASAGAVVLSWDHGGLPDGLDLRIYLPELDRVLVSSMRSVSEVQLAVPGEPLLVRFEALDSATGVGAIPRPLLGLQALPNPFNPLATIRFELDRSCRARLVVHDLTGRVVTVLVDEAFGAGSHRIAWDGTDSSGRAVASGAYLVSLEAAGAIESRKMSLIR